MDIRGLVPFSLIDYPGKLAAVVFTAGCNLRCPFCHNPCLIVDPQSQPQISLETFYPFLDVRKNFLDGVVFSGGEPALQCDLPEVLRVVRGMGYAVKLDTNGTFPERVRELLDKDLIQAAGVDYKLPARRYETLGLAHAAEKVRQTLAILVEAGIFLDVRTTVHPAYLSREDLLEMRDELLALGISHWHLQQFHEVDILDESLKVLPPYTDHQLFQFSQELGTLAHVRGLYGKEFSK